MIRSDFMAKFPNEPQEVNDSDFDEFIKKYPLTIVDCWAEWCMPCKMISPVIDELAKSFEGKIVFGKAEIDKNMAIAQKFGVMSIPALLVFKNGEHIDTIIGALPKTALEGKFSSYLE
ncbi:MAG: thioredoxin [Candidatus Aenigmarchaeota archaeon]|nr:thioredoxin [Candidatus Aenigmarchaeota archaeon]